jgi:hypothetical protein
VFTRAYLVVGWDHGGDVAHGEGLAGLQAQGHRRAHAGVGAGEHHVLHVRAEEGKRPSQSQVGEKMGQSKNNNNKKAVQFPRAAAPIDKRVGRSALISGFARRHGKKRRLLSFDPPPVFVPTLFSLRILYAGADRREFRQQDGRFRARLYGLFSRVI